MIQVVIVEDDRDFIYLIRTMLERERGIEVIGSYEEELAGELPEEFFRADLVIMDLNLSSSPKGKESGIRMARKIRSRTDARILILTGYEEPETILKASQQTFASGCLLKKNYQGLPFMIRSILAGNAPEEIYICSALLRKLSHAERFVLMEYLGYEVKINSSSKTKSNQMSSIVQKFGLDKPADLYKIFKNYPDLSRLNEDLR
ncbi:MAG: response regulator [Ruminococcus sp.]